METEGYRVVSGTNLYVKGDEVYRSTVVDGSVKLSRSEMTVVDGEQVLVRPPLKYADIPSLMTEAEKAAVGPKVKFTWTVTPGFRKEINQAISDISPEVRQLLDESGVKIFAPRRVIARADELGLDLAQTPRGYPQGATFASCPGFYDPIEKQIVVAKRAHSFETVMDENGVKRAVNQSYWSKEMSEQAATVRHEVGHAVDDSLGKITQSKAYKEAYQSDLAGLPEKVVVNGHEYQTAELYDYFIKPDKPSQCASESFAELFSAIYRGGKTDERLAAMETLFPRCAEVLRQRVNLLKEELSITSYLRAGQQLPASQDYLVSKLIDDCTVVKTRSGMVIFHSAKDGTTIVRTADGVESTIRNGVRNVTKSVPTKYDFPTTAAG